MNCGDTQWCSSAADGNCYNGYAFNIEFEPSALNVTLPDEIVFGVAYDTHTHGANPIGGIGPYSSLNVAVHDQPPTVGTDVEAKAMFVDSTWAGNCSTRHDSAGRVPPRRRLLGALPPAVRFNLQPAEIALTPSANMICDADSVTIDFSGVNAMYGYEFVVEYDAAKVNATGSFINTWFNTSGASIPWDGSCAAGVCKFAVSLQGAPTGVSGSGPVAKINLTDKAGGAFQLKIKDVVLSDIDGFTIPATVVDDTSRSRRLRPGGLRRQGQPARSSDADGRRHSHVGQPGRHVPQHQCTFQRRGQLQRDQHPRPARRLHL